MGKALPTPIVCEAIRRRLLLTLTYHEKSRTLEPYCHGEGPKGREVLVAFQRGGGSQSGQTSGWKALYLDETTDLLLTNAVFPISREDYVPMSSKNLRNVHCCVWPADYVKGQN